MHNLAPFFFWRKREAFWINKKVGHFVGSVVVVHFIKRWVIIRPAPPPKLWPRITTSREPFSGLTFLCFFFKLKFWIYPTTSCLSKLFKKPILELEILFGLIFYIKYKVVPSVFFDLDENSSSAVFVINIYVIFRKKVKFLNIP